MTSPAASSRSARPADALPTVLIPGLLCTPRIYAEQLPALWRFGQVTVADHTRDDASGIPGARLVTVSDAGHLTTLEQPGHVARALVDWMEMGAR
jgi:pimeloyl-ACP methyl ester carboxylesterase